MFGPSVDELRVILGLGRQFVVQREKRSSVIKQPHRPIRNGEPLPAQKAVSEQRVRWFSRGFESGQPNDCDTFAAPSL